MASSVLHTLALLCLCGSGVSSTDKDNNEAVTVNVGQNAIINCSPQKTPQDGVFMYKELFKKQKVTYLYKDGTFTPRDPFVDRLETNRNLENFVVSIKNVTVWDTGVYWCVFNKEDQNSDSTQKTLLVVSGKQAECPKEKREMENTSMLLISVCVAAAFVMLLITVILLWTIPKIKHCCERGKFAPPHQQGDGVYEEMCGRRTPAAHTLINPAYQTSRHTPQYTTETNY